MDRENEFTSSQETNLSFLRKKEFSALKFSSTLFWQAKNSMESTNTLTTALLSVITTLRGICSETLFWQEDARCSKE
jgi:hypothetical protein